VIHITRDLLTVLLDQAAERDPDATSLRLSATRAGEFDEDTGLDPSMPVVTHFTPAGVGGSVNAVFGVDIGTPAGRGGARFISHPNGFLGVSKRGRPRGGRARRRPAVRRRRGVAAFDRAGNGIELAVLDAAPPEESLPE